MTPPLYPAQKLELRTGAVPVQLRSGLVRAMPIGERWACGCEPLGKAPQGESSSGVGRSDPRVGQSPDSAFHPRKSTMYGCHPRPQNRTQGRHVAGGAGRLLRSVCYGK